MSKKLFQHDRKGSDGKYTAAVACDCCGKPTNEAERYTDDEVCGGGDGPGFYLCHRKRCIDKRDNLGDAETRRAYYTNQRAKNDARGTAP